MMQRVIAAILALLASGVFAQTSITPSGGGGSSTVTSGTTATSGCIAGGVLRSISNLVDCSAGLTYVSNVLTVDSSAIIPTISGSTAANGDITINGTTSATKTTSFVVLQATGGFVGIGAPAPNARLEVNDVTTNANGLGQIAAFSSEAAAIDMGGKVDFGGNYSGGQAVWAGIGGLKESSGVDYAGYLLFRTRPSGGSMTVRARISSVGGIQLLTGTKPACNSSTRGTLYYVAGGAGVADTYEVCVKDAADAYAWATIF